MSQPTLAPPSRLHRLPHRTDYILIPAPLDLSLSEATEKSSLPAIIVTPSSPSSAHDFSIAFLEALEAPPKPSLRERIASWKHYGSPQPLRIRSIIIILFIFFGLVCHFAAGRLAARRPYLELTTYVGDDARVLDSPMGWTGFQSLFGRNAASVYPEYIINQSSGPLQ